MIIKKYISKDKKSITLEVIGDLTIKVHEEFRNAYIDEAKDTIFIIDFTKTEMVDSSGLSLLLLLRDFSENEDKSITLKGCNKRVREILEVANFNKLFTL